MKNNVLYISHYPGEPFDGGNIHVYNVIKNLDNTISPNVLYYYYNDEKLGDTDLILNNIKGISIKEKINNLSRLKYILLGKAPGPMYLEEKLKKKLVVDVKKIIVKYDIDILHVWGPNIAGCLEEINDIKKIITPCDSFSLLHRSYAKNSKFLKKIYHKLVSKLYKNYEKKIYNNFDEVVFLTSRDMTNAKCIVDRKYYVIPNGINTKQENMYLKNKEKTSDKIILGFHGNLEYSPNFDAVKYLVNILGPKLSEIYGREKIEIHLIGKGNLGDLINEKNFDYVKNFGYVEDLEKALLKLDIYISPLFSGAGMKNKILEAFSLGIPIVGTSESFVGINVGCDFDYLLANNEEVFIEKIFQLLKNKEKRFEISDKVYKSITKEYSWKNISKKYLELYGEN